MPHAEYTPQLATLVKAPPTGNDWVHEIKFDGYRIGCRIRKERIRLLSRNGKDWTAAFPDIVAAVSRLRIEDALIDGEVTMVLPDGRTSFQALQNAFSGQPSDATLVYFMFDLLRLNGERLERLPLEERKARLRGLCGRLKKGRLRYAEHVVGTGETFFAQACRLGLEGIISKRRGRPYTAGRHGDWLKTKCVHRQEFVIAGFTEPEGMRAGIGALIVGYYERDRLIFSGKVGTGFSHVVAVQLRRDLDALERATSPFDPMPKALGRNVHWVNPKLVCDVEFTEWTSDGRIRHPSFQGLRADKKPRDVTRERESAPPSIEASPPASPRARKSHASESGNARDVVAGVGISHADRVVYPDPKTTKIDVARYYERIANWIVPHVEGRPLTLVRCPAGISGECFFMKHAKVWAPAPLRRVRIQEKTKIGEYLIADDIASIVGLVQMGVLEIHTWNSAIDDVERPNRIVIDLDPGEEVAWPRVVHAARVVRKALAALDLEAWPKTTGGRGLHVVVPLAPHAEWPACLEFTRMLSERIEQADPDTYTTRFAKSGRGHQILIDYLRNNRTNTSIAAYSTRARPHAPVSVPVTWDELRSSLRPESFTVATLPRRLERLRADPWKAYWSSRQKLTAQRIRAVRE